MDSKSSYNSALNFFQQLETSNRSEAEVAKAKNWHQRLRTVQQRRQQQQFSSRGRHDDDEMRTKTRGSAEAKPNRGSVEAKPNRGSVEAKPNRGSAEAKPNRGSVEAKPSFDRVSLPNGIVPPHMGSNLFFKLFPVYQKVMKELKEKWVKIKEHLEKERQQREIFEETRKRLNEELLNRDTDPSHLVNFTTNVRPQTPEEERNEELRRYYLNSFKTASKPCRSLEEKQKNIEKHTFDAGDTQRDDELKKAVSILTCLYDSEGVDFNVGDNNAGNSDIRIVDSRPTEAMIVAMEFNDFIISGHTFEELSSNSELRKEKELEVRKGVALATGVPVAEVVVVGIKKGSVKFEVVIPQSVLQRISPHDKKAQQEIYETKELIAKQFQTSHPYSFKRATATIKNIKDSLQLTPGDFDERGDFQFPIPEGEMQKRGGQDYYQPSSKWKRYGFRVLGLYENDDWIMMDGREGEWAVAFHGPSGCIDVAAAIAKSRTLVKGAANVYAGGKSSNGKGDIPEGIYFARDVEMCYNQAVTIGGQQYQLAFQCRVHPDHIWDTGNGSTWIVVDESRWIRPYGIVVKKV